MSYTNTCESAAMHGQPVSLLRRLLCKLMDPWKIKQLFGSILSENLHLIKLAQTAGKISELGMLCWASLQTSKQYWMNSYSQADFGKNGPRYKQGNLLVV